MSLHRSILVSSAALVAASGPGHRAAPAVQVNPNTHRAGVLEAGVLTVTLEAKKGLLQVDGPHRPAMTIEAFAEPGKAPLIPGPLLRAPAGTEIKLAIRNSLSMPLTFFVPAVVHGGPDRFEALDSIVVAPGATGSLTTRATTPGNYVYRATLPTRSAAAKHVAGVLAGALIVDSARSTVPHDRVFVIMEAWDSVRVACGDTAARPNVECAVGRIDNTINGRSWPNTERIAATMGDSVHWRVLNASGDVHPMHLHGYYYRVDEYAGWLPDVTAGRPSPGQIVATQMLPPLAGMAMTWSPDRPGNWLFHCHFATHLQADSMSAAPDDPHMRDMVGLVLGINVAEKPGVQVAGEPAAARHLRLIALEDSTEMATNSHVVLPSMHFLLEDGSRRVDAGPDFSPELDLTRGEPVAITIVNRMTEPTTIHWHGIEVEDSYVDGVAGFSGAGKRRAPAIAPGDSFVARFTPPRSGTFMYHAHVDDNREQSAGLIGAIVVRDPRTTISPDDHVFFLKSSRLGGAASTPVEINGQLHPDTIVMHAGTPARLRFINLSAHHNSARADFRLESLGGGDSVQWLPIAKDGADLPANLRAPRIARQVVSIGETYDFEYTPARAGMMRLQLSGAPGPLGRGAAPLIAVPIRVDPSSASTSTAPLLHPNPNTASAGVLRDGVLTVGIEAKQSLWRFANNRPPMTVEAFSEEGKAPVMPGPFLRVPAGTQLRMTIRNSLALPLTFVTPAALHGGPDRIDAMDTLVVRPGAVDTLNTRADVVGSYVYRGALPDGASKVSHIGGALVGAIVVDSTPTPPPERVFVIMATEDARSRACDDTTTGNAITECHGRRFFYTLNGVQWPNTDRIHATVGDSLHWRVINASAQVHPMHLHGFYYRVDALSGPFVDAASRPAPGQLVVTQLLDALSSMSMTWSPQRPGNWLFHCHFALHNSSYSLLETPEDPDMRDMVGLVIGTIVTPRPGVVAAGHPAPARRLRLVAEPEGVRMPNGADTLPGMRFVLEEHGRRVDTHADVSPELDLVRGEPVSITIVNHLDEPTSVHWHGIEVEDSYMDGAAGFSGEGQHLAPAIAPRDSFTARFTPTRSGTFMYHAHMDEMREELAGLEGMLIVRDSAGAAPNDYALMFKGDPSQPLHPLEINGRRDPDTLVFHVGQRTRVRLGNLSTAAGTAAPSFWLTARPDSAARIGRDTMLVRWQPVAKDGFDLPASARSPRAAQQVVSVGETFDFEYTPTTPGILRLEVRAPRGQHGLLMGVPIRVAPNAAGDAVVRPNPNTARAGVLRDGVLTATLEAKESLWHLDGPTDDDRGVRRGW